MTISIASMIGALETFDSRCREIERFFEMLQFMTDNRPSSLSSSSSTNAIPGSVYPISRELEKTLRASGYLMLYNLVEATMTNAIAAIHEHITVENVGFDDLREDMRKVAIKGLRKAVSSETPVRLLDANIPISNAIIWLGFDKRELFSGNLDSRLIKKKANEYGFEVARHDLNDSRDGSRLVEVKNKRNDLAHGVISFEDCGHETSLDDLISTFSETKIFLQATLDGISDYLQNRRYLHVL